MSVIANQPAVFRQTGTPGGYLPADNPRPGDLWIDMSVPALKRLVANNPDVWVSIEGGAAATVFNKGAVMLNPTVTNIIAWQAPFACTVTNVRAYQDVGTGSTFNARRNGTLNHLAAGGTISSAATWIDGGVVQNVAYNTNDKLEVMITAVNGAPNQLAIIVDFTQP